MKAGDQITVEYGHGLYPGSIVRWKHAKSEDRNRSAYRKVTAVDKAKAIITIRELTTFEWWRWRAISYPKQALRHWFPEYSPNSAFEYRYLPLDALRWCFAWAWTQVWYPVNHLHYWIREHLPRLFLLTRYFLPLGGGRREDPDPVYCGRCLWAGPTRWLIHTYTGGWDEDSDVEAVDECPRCGMEV